MLVVSTIA